MKKNFLNQAFTSRSFSHRAWTNFGRANTINTQKHKLDKELFHLLVSSTKQFDDAFDSYFEDKFDLEILYERSISIFTNSRNIDTSFGADIFLKKHLQDLIKYNKISLKKITQEYRQRFYYELFGKIKREGKMDSDTRKLLEFFQLEDNATLKDLKTF